MDDQPTSVTRRSIHGTRGGYLLITYVGIGFLLIGTFVFLVAGTNTSGLGVFLAFGVAAFGMGLILSYIGHKSSGSEIVLMHEGGNSLLPLGRIHSEIERSRSELDASAGNRAFGFVMISLGVFVLSVSGLTGFYLGSWPLLLLGSAFLVPGIFLRMR